MRITFSMGLFGLAVVGATVCARAAAPASGDVKQWVDQKVADCEPKREERRFDETGWVTAIGPALKLAREHNRPVFLFTHDGHMAVGRC
jgi:hypothetical protein